jgi:hypothetical protein
MRLQFIMAKTIIAATITAAAFLYGIGIVLAWSAERDEALMRIYKCVEEKALNDRHPAPYSEGAWDSYAPLCTTPRQ